MTDRISEILHNEIDFRRAKLDRMNKGGDTDPEQEQETRSELENLEGSLQRHEERMRDK